MNVNINNLFNEILNKINFVNERTLQITNNVVTFFHQNTLGLSKDTSNSHNFSQVVSFLYVLYIECSGYNLKFIQQREDFKKNNNNVHYFTIISLRTYEQHYTDISNAEDKAKINHRNNWFNELIGINEPEDEKQWIICLQKLMEEAINYLDKIILSIDNIEVDELKDIIIKDWISKSLRNHSKYEYEKVFNKVAIRIGKQNIDFNKFFSKYNNIWKQELESMSLGYDFDIEMEKRMERDLLEYKFIPIDGNDIISYLKIKPGKLVAELLKMAYLIYEENPCTKDELLEKLKIKYLLNLRKNHNLEDK